MSREYLLGHRVGDRPQSTGGSQTQSHPHQSEALEGRMLPQGVVEHILQQRVPFPLTVTFEDAHSEGFPPP